MEFEDQEEDHEQLEAEAEAELAPSYHHDSLSNNPAPTRAAAQTAPSHQIRKAKYKECLKNHAVGIGGHAVDGCGEFIPAGADGTLESLKCAACNCHRNFHRRESSSSSAATAGFAFHHRPPHFGYLHVAPQPRAATLLALPSSSGGGGGGGAEMEDYYYSQYSTGGGGKKRFRTKFTAEQKEKMLSFAGRLGWRIQKQDDEMVEQFCNEVGISRQVLKVWMHNNKNTLGKKTSE